MTNCNLSRRSFGLGLIAHGLTACDRVANYAIPTKFAEQNVPVTGKILNLNSLPVHGYIEGNGAQDIVFISLNKMIILLFYFAVVIKKSGKRH